MPTTVAPARSAQGLHGRGGHRHVPGHETVAIVHPAQRLGGVIIDKEIAGIHGPSAHLEGLVHAPRLWRVASRREEGKKGLRAPARCRHEKQSDERLAGEQSRPRQAAIGRASMFDRWQAATT